MRSLYEDILTTLEGHTFSIPNVSVRKPYDESIKTYPMLVVHDIANLPLNQSTVNGESRTIVANQIDILTENCVDSESTVLNRWEAARRLYYEVAELLDETYKLTRRTAIERPMGTDVYMWVWRGDAILDSDGYTYRV